MLNRTRCTLACQQMRRASAGAQAAPFHARTLEPRSRHACATGAHGDPARRICNFGSTYALDPKRHA
eukprot:12285042-Alexandrium_andersonii.AAC.1